MKMRFKPFYTKTLRVLTVYTVYNHAQATIYHLGSPCMFGKSGPN